MYSYYSGHMPELETQMEATNESLQIETGEEELRAVDDAIERESSILDEILTVESAESIPRLNGDTNSGGQQRKEVMVPQVQITLIFLHS